MDVGKCYSDVANKGVEIEYSLRTRDFLGPSGSVGHVLRDTPRKVSARSFDLKSEKREEEKKKAERFQKSQIDDLKLLFWNKTDDHLLLNKIKSYVELGMKRVEDDLESKRNKLKVNLLKEESELTQEFIEKAQKSADKIYEEKIKMADAIQNRNVQEGQIFAQEAYDRLFKESSDEFRKRQVLDNKRYCTKINEFQMRDKILYRMKEKEEDQMWINEMEKLEKAKAEGIDEEAQYDKTKLNKNYGYTDDILIKQLQGNRLTKELENKLKLEEQQFWKGLDRMFKEDDMALRKRLAQDKEQRRQALLKQIEDNRLRKVKENEEERLFDEVLKKQNDLDLAKEKAQIKDERKSERRELDIFKESVQQVRNARRQDEKDLEVLVAQEMQKIEDLRKCNRDKARKAKDLLFQEVLETRDRQVEANAKKTQDEKRDKQAMAEYSNFRWKQNDDLDKAKEKETHEIHEKHFVDLKAQESYEKLLKKRGEDDDFQWVLDRKEEERVDQQRAQELLRNQKQTRVHPFIRAFDPSIC